MTTVSRAFAAVALGAAIAVSAGPASAQDYPGQAIEWIAPSSAGSGFDVVARIIAPKLSEAIGAPVVVRNVAGAGSTVGATVASEAAPDGYTILIVNVGHTSAEALRNDLAYSLLDSFDPIMRFAVSFHVLVAHPSVEAQTLDEFLAQAKENPGELNFATAGIGSSTFTAGQLFVSRAGIEMEHIPYAGGGKAMTAIVAGEVDFYASPFSTAKPFIDDGQLRALAITAAERASYLPDVPTVAESIPGFEFNSWYGLMVPKGTPEDVREKLQAALSEALADEQVRASLSGIGFDVVEQGPEEFRTYIADEIDMLKALVAEAGIEPQN